MHKIKPHFATQIGILALLFWSTAAVIVVFVGRLPIFEMQFFIFLFSFFIAVIKFRFSLFTLFKTIPVYLFFLGMAGIYLNNLFFISAFKHAPAEKVDLINYLWPIMVVLLSSLLPKERIKLQHFAGALMAFYGVFLLLTNGIGLGEIDLQCRNGYIYAFLDAICWAIFTVSLRKYKHASNALIGICCGISAVLSLLTHCVFEDFVMPSTMQFCLMAILGFTSQGLAYYFWDFGIKNGNYRLLYVLSYFNPIISIGFLILFGFTAPSPVLFTSAVLVCMGAFVASEKFEDLLSTVRIKILQFQNGSS